MRSPWYRLALFAGAVFLVVACGAAKAGPRKASREVVDPVAQARILAERGDHLAASRYLEAALAAGVPEVEVLHGLMVEQVRAGRLLAARATGARLAVLRPNAPELAFLLEAVEAALAGTPKLTEVDR